VSGPAGATSRSDRFPSAWWLAGLAVAPITAYAVVAPESAFQGSTPLFLLAGAAFAVVGGFVASQRPEHRMGWIFCAYGLLVGLAATGNVLSARLSPAKPESSLWAWAANIPISAVVGVLLLTFLLFPSGRLPSPRWKPVAWLVAFQMAVGVSAAFLAGGFAGVDEADYVVKSPFPDAVEKAGETLSAIFFFPLTTAMFMASVVAFVLRYRKAVGDEREQIRWFAFAATIQLSTIVITFLVPASGAAAQELTLALLALAFTTTPVVMGVAILKYRLYDIEVVVNKTIVFAALASFITVVYVGVVVGVGSLVGRGDEPNLALSVAATAIVAVAFQPVRGRVQRVANRLVYGERATPYEVLSAFSARMGETAPPEELLGRLARLVAEGTGATEAQVWLRVGAELRPAASWPEVDEPDESPLQMDGEELPTLAFADRAVPVTHHNELLGALTIVKPRGETVSPTEDKLVADVAAQAGLVLRNVRLTAELLDRVEELRASRQRLVTAQDDERRRLERDLHDGAQQQLAAIKINLSMAKTMAVEAGADDAATLIDQLKTYTDEAVQTLRELAHGIYPPVLASDGLGAALTARTRRTPLRVAIEADGLGRYSQDVEAAVYFCCLEALQNVVKYAEATTAKIEVADHDGMLAFVVSDDGRGFEPSSAARGAGMQNMTDRLDSLGGSLLVDAAPGRGTKITGRLPVAKSGKVERTLHEAGAVSGAQSTARAVHPLTQ